MKSRTRAICPRRDWRKVKRRREIISHYSLIPSEKPEQPLPQRGERWGVSILQPELRLAGNTWPGTVHFWQDVQFNYFMGECWNVSWGNKDKDAPRYLAMEILDFPGGSVRKESAWSAGDGLGFNPWVRKIPWRKKWQPSLVFLSGQMPWVEEPGRLQSMGS